MVMTQGSIIFDGSRGSSSIAASQGASDNLLILCDKPGTPPGLSDEDDQPRQPNCITSTIYCRLQNLRSKRIGQWHYVRKYTIAEQIRRRNRDRAKQDAAALNRRRPSTDIAQDNTSGIPDIVEHRSGRLTGFLQLATDPGERQIGIRQHSPHPRPRNTC